MVSIIPADTKRGDEFDHHGCGGTLIAGTWVLTAAHCLAKAEDGDAHGKARAGAPDATNAECNTTREFDVYAGSANFKNGERLKGVEACRHPHYDSLANRNDIGLLRLERAPKVASAAPVAIATEEDEAAVVKAGGQALLLGWGDKDGNGAKRQLAVTQQKVVTHTACDTALREHRHGQMAAEFDKFMPEHLKNLGLPFDGDTATADIYASMTKPVFDRAGVQIDSTMICATDLSGKRGHCVGDSGGPLIANNARGQPVQIGIVSWGESCVHEIMPPGVYVRASQFRDWIAKYVK